MDDNTLMRYSRQILMPDFGVEGQAALLSARVLVVGLGGLGCPVALYLAAAGVGKLRLVDHDEVELSNLQRQVAHTEARLGVNKAASAAEQLQALNSDCQVEVISQAADAGNLPGLLRAIDVVVDCSDRFSVRDAVNRACLDAGVPLVSGAAIRSEGQLAVFDFRQADAPCYRCVYPDLSAQAESCSESGVLAPLVGIIGTMQAMEALRLISGFGQPATGRLSAYWASEGNWRSFTLSRNPQCPVCSGR